MHYYSHIARSMLVLLVFPILFCSCATILTPKYQKVNIYPKGDKVLVNGGKPHRKDGQYALQRDRKAKHITVQKDGYKDLHKTVLQYKYSPYRILSFVPFGVLFYPMFLDYGKKAFNFPKEIRFEKPLVKIPKKTAQQKNIRLNNVSMNLKKSDISYRFYSTYKRYIKDRSRYESKGSEKIEVDQTVLPTVLNKILRETGFIDTSNKVLKTSYANNLYLNANITDFTIQHVANIDNPRTRGGLVALELGVEWELLDYYKNKILTVHTRNKSGQFPLNYRESFNHMSLARGAKDKSMLKAAKDAMAYGLIEVLKKPKVTKKLNEQKLSDQEKSLETLTLPTSNNFVSDVSESIQSTVTIKLTKGHGSGFVVSNNGHILTCYHVIADQDTLSVETSDNQVYSDVEVVRISKQHDLALLKINPDQKIKPFKIIQSEENIKIANTVFAVGTPSGEDLGQTVSKGIISGLRETDNNAKLIQTDASVNAGNSGGPIVYKDGQVSGVISAKLMGFGVEGVSFGVPSYLVLDALKIKQ